MANTLGGFSTPHGVASQRLVVMTVTGHTHYRIVERSYQYSDHGPVFPCEEVEVFHPDEWTRID
jgi:hypothetical protein